MSLFRRLVIANALVALVFIAVVLFTPVTVSAPAKLPEAKYAIRCGLIEP